MQTLFIYTAAIFMINGLICGFSMIKTTISPNVAAEISEEESKQ